MITFACPKCNKSLSVKDELAGRKGKCPGCGQAVVVPGQKAGDSLSQADSLKTLPPRPDSGVSEPDTHLSRSASVSGDGNTELYDFLAPAQGADELGRLGPYRILKVLGAGGMGVVFQAEDPALKRKVALKVMLPSLAASESARKRFVREAQTAAAIEHDHIVHIYQVGEDRGVPFIAMQFLKGEPLDVRLQSAGRVSVAEAMRIGREAAQGLAAAHEHGLIHRDIKPANLWLEAQGEPGASATGGRVKILDFGLARAAADDSQLTQSGAIIGTPAYMAPEQANSQPVDARCDLFSLGCVLYRLCTGELPFKGKDTISTLMAVATEEPPSPAELNDEVPAGLSDLIMELLAKKAEDRPASARAVAEALTELEKSPQARVSRSAGKSTARMPRKSADEDTARPGTLRKGKKAARRQALPPWLGWAVAASVLVIVGIVALVLAFRGGSTVKEPTGPGQASIDGVKTSDKNPAKVIDPAGKPPIEKPAIYKPPPVKPLPPDGKEEKVVPGDDRSVALWAVDRGVRISIKNNKGTWGFFAARNQPADLWEREWHKPFTLHTVEILATSNITDSDMQNFANLSNLDGFITNDTQLTDGGLAQLKGLNRLTRLELFEGPFSDAGLAALPDLPKLGVLKLVKTKVMGPGLKHLRKFPKLHALMLQESPVTDVGLEELGKLPRIPPVLDLMGTKVTDAGLAHLAKSSSLQQLTLAQTDISDAGLIHLGVIRGLVILDLNKTRVTGFGLAHFKDHRYLNTLDLSHASITDGGLEFLKNLRVLQTLKLEGTKIGDAGLANIDNLKLSWLELKNTQVSNAGMEFLRKQTELQVLGLQGTGVSDEGLAKVQGLKMRNLDLENTKITDASVPHLREFKLLYRLVLNGTRVSAAGVDELKKALPKCYVEH